MRVLITGGAGFIGRHLTQQLHQDGHAVRILDSLHPQVHGDSTPAQPSGVEALWGDVRDTALLARAMDGVDVVHHLAAETGVGQSQYEIARYVSANTFGTATVLEAAVAARVQQVVIASSRAVYGEGRAFCEPCEQSFAAPGRQVADLDSGFWEVRCPACQRASTPLPMSEDTPLAPSSVYGVTKLQQEELAVTVGRAHGLPVTILRFFNVFGPGQALSNPYVGVLGTFYRRASAGDTVDIYEDGRMQRDFVFVKDVVEALRGVTANERAFGEVLNVGTGEAVTLSEVAAAVFDVLELEPRLHVSGRYRIGDIRHAVADVARLETALGFRPRTSFRDGLRAYLDWARAHHAESRDAQAELQLAAKNLLRQGRL